MAETRPIGEQILFKSSKTGDQILDAYLEACEQGNRTLPDMIQELFDSSGNFAKLMRVMGNWAAATPYEKLDVVTNNNSVYICTQNHTSGGAFDPSKFVLAMSPAGAFSLASTNPAAIGSAAAVGVGGTAARSDHVHPPVDLGTGSVTGTLPLAKGGVGGTTQGAAQATLGVPPATRQVATDGTTLSGGGDLSANRTLSAIMPLGQCRLTRSAGTGNLELVRYAGRFLFINGKNELIPATPPSLAPAGLQAPVTSTQFGRAAGVATIVTAAAHGLSVGDTVSVSLNSASTVGSGLNGNYVVASVPNSTTFTYAQTGNPDIATQASTNLTIAPLYYIYAWMNAGTMTLEASPKAPMQDATYGNMIKNITPAGAATPDATRSLVGMVRVVAGPNFADSNTQRFVLSYYNRKPLRLRAANLLVTGIGTGDVERLPSLRCEWLLWADSLASLRSDGWAFNSIGGQYISSYIIVDGAIIASTYPLMMQDGAGNVYSNAGIGDEFSGSEGYHFSSWGAATSSGASGSANMYNHGMVWG